MAQLFFKVRADYEQVLKLRQEIEKLDKILNGTNRIDYSAYKKLTSELHDLTQKYNKLCEKATIAAEKVKRSGEDADTTTTIFQRLGKTMGIIGGTKPTPRIDNAKIQRDADKTKKIVGGVVDEVKSVTGNFDNLANESEETWKRSNAALQIQRDVVKRLKEELPLLEAAFKKVNVSTQDPKVLAERKKLSKAVRELRAELEGEEEALRELEKANTVVVEKQQTLITHMRNVKNEMAQLKFTGQQNTEMYREKAEELRKLATAQRELFKEQQLLSTGGSNITGMLSGMRALSGAMAAGAGAMGLVNTESEEYARIQTRIQSLLAITIGLQQVQNTLHQTSAFRIQTVGRAKQAWMSAVRFLNVQMGISIGLSKAFVATGIGAIVAAIGLAVIAMNRWIRRQREINELQQRFNGISRDVAREVAIQRSRIEQLMRVAENYTKNLELRQKAVAELNRLMPDFNGHINQEGKLIANSADALRNYLTNLAKVERARRLMMSIQEEEASIAADREAGGNIAWWRRATAAFLSPTDRAEVLTRDQERANAKLEKSLEERNQNVAKKQAELDGLIGEITPESAAKLFGLSAEIEKDLYTELQRQIDAQNRINEKHRQLKRDARRRGFDIQQAEINGMQEGFERKEAQLKLNLRRELDMLDEHEQELIRRNTAIARAEWELLGDAGVFDRVVGLNYLQQAEIEMLRQAKEAQHERDMGQMLNDLLSRFRTHEEQRAEIVREFAEKRAQIERENTEGQFDANIEELNKREREELVRIDILAQDRTKIISAIFADMSQKSIEELQAIHAEAQDLLAFLSGGVWNAEQGAIFGLTRERFYSITEDIAQMSQVTQRVEGVGQSILGLLTPVERVRMAFKALFDPTSIMTKEHAIRELEQAFRDYADAVSFVSDTIRVLGETIENQRLQDLAESLSTAVDIANSTMQGAQIGAKIGGPAGAVVGAATGLVRGIFTATARARESARQAREELQRFNDAVERGERNHQALLRERLRMVQQIGETDLQFQQRITAELLKQQRDISSEIDKVMAQLAGEQFVAGKTTSRSGGFLGIGRRTNVNKVMGSLAGKSFEDLERLNAQGKLTDRARELFLQLQALKNEGAEVDRMLQEGARQWQETIAGITFDDMRNSFADMMRQGRIEIQDIADYMQSVFQRALINSLLAKYFDEHIGDLVEDMLASVDDGTYQRRQGEFERRAQDIGNRMNAALAPFEHLFTQSQGAASMGVWQGMKEQTAGALEGRFAALQMSGVEILTESKLQTIIQNAMADGIRLSNEILDEQRMAQNSMVQHLKAISGHTSYLPQMAADIKKVRANTDKL